MRAALVPLVGLAMPLAWVEDELHPRQHATENIIRSNFLVVVPESEQVPDYGRRPSSGAPGGVRVALFLGWLKRLLLAELPRCQMPK
jgi:hypothetical protein